MRDKNSLNRRYFYKIGSNVIAILSGIVASAIVPRALGVNKYGDFNFTNNIINQLLTFLDMRLSTGFYVKLSQRREETKLITFYGIYTLFVFLVLLVVIAILTLPSNRQLLFENIGSKIIWLSLCFVGVRWVADILIKISDAHGVTSKVESIKIFTYIFSMAVLAALFYFDLINIESYYFYQISFFGVLMVFIFSFFKKENISIPLKLSMDTSDLTKYSKEFFTYSYPLALYLTITLVTEIFDRYILQHYGGSYQQGLYSFSFSMSNMMILFVTAMVPLFTRELSIAFVENNIEHASELYRKYVPVLYVVVAYFCCFLFVNANDVLLIFGGEEYTESIVSLRILLLYPLVSTYSNLNGSVVYATNRTILFRNISIILSPLGMVISYLLISNYFMDLGAIGLSIKVVLTELISVVIVTTYISKYLKIKTYKYLLHMIFSPLILLGIAFLIKISLSYFEVVEAGNIFGFLLSGILYTFLFILIIWGFPIFIGVSKASVVEIVNRMTKKTTF